MKSFIAFIRKYFQPRYDELNLLLMALAFLILLVLDAGMRDELAAFVLDIKDYDTGPGPPGTEGSGLVFVLGLLVLLVMGFYVTAYHAFSRRPKNVIHKGIMLVFGIILSASSGIVAGIQVLQQAGGWLSIFPIWNIACSVLLLYQSDNPDLVSEMDVELSQIFVGGIALLIIAVFCTHALHYHWAIVFSICVSYAISVDRFVQEAIKVMQTWPSDI